MYSVHLEERGKKSMKNGGKYKKPNSYYRQERRHYAKAIRDLPLADYIRFITI